MESHSGIGFADSTNYQGDMPIHFAIHTTPREASSHLGHPVCGAWEANQTIHYQLGCGSAALRPLRLCVRKSLCPCNPSRSNVTPGKCYAWEMHRIPNFIRLLRRYAYEPGS